MQITNLSAGKRDPNRVNVFIDGSFRFSMALTQVVDHKLKIGRELSEEEVTTLKQASDYGKIYGRALEWCLSRPRSTKELNDYLSRKRLAKRDKNGELQQGVSLELTDAVATTILEKGYVDDRKFANWWVENRNTRKGTSMRKLRAELGAKGISPTLVEEMLSVVDRDDLSELKKVIEKKRRRYSDDTKFIAYLARQGFVYEDIKRSLSAESEE